TQRGPSSQECQRREQTRSYRLPRSARHSSTTPWLLPPPALNSRHLCPKPGVRARSWALDSKLAHCFAVGISLRELQSLRRASMSPGSSEIALSGVCLPFVDLPGAFAE